MTTNLNHRISGINNPAKYLIILLSLILVFPKLDAQPSPNGQTEAYQYARFSPSLAVIIVVLIAALFFMGFFSIYLRHCGDGPSVRGVLPVTGASRPGSRGLDKEVIENFPTFPYSEVKHLKIGKGALECAVCLNEFEEEETLRLLPKCDHVFHPECIDAWLSSHTTCPVCRTNLSILTGEENSGAGTVAVTQGDSDELSRRETELDNSVSIRVGENENVNEELEVVNPNGLGNQNRQFRSKSIKWIIFSKFSRSHSTGHSLVQPGENIDRFTLKLPDDIRKQIMGRRLNRTTSLVVLPREASSRRGYRTGDNIDGSSRGKSIKRLGSLDRANKSDRWIFSMAPPFFVRQSSFNVSPRVYPDNGEGTSKRLGMMSKFSFNRLGSKRDNPGSMADDSTKTPPV